MDNRDLALSLLVLVVFVSGCVTGGGGTTEQESTASITLHSLDVQPEQIYDGSSVRVSMDVANTGNLQADINTADDGSNVLRDHCRDIFDIEDFQSQPESLSEGETDTLYPSQEARLRWELQQTGNVPKLYDQECNLKFQIPFNYSVSAYKQIQIKQDRSVEGTQTLQSESSSGPLLLEVATVGGTGEEGIDTFISGQDESFRILLQLRNTQETGYNKGVIDIREETLEVSADEPLDFSEDYDDMTGDSDSNCNLDRDNPIRMFEGSSRVITCDFDLSNVDVSRPSMVSEITASVDYSYLKDAGSRTVTVKYSGN